MTEFQTFSHQKIAFSAASYIQNYRDSKLEKAHFSKSHFQKKRLRSHLQMIISQKVGGVWT